MVRTSKQVEIGLGMILERHLVALSIDDMEVVSRGNLIITDATNKEIPCATRDILQITNENVQIYGNNSP